MRIALTGYRGNPYVGGQGVYLRHLSREIAALGVQVDVISGPPYPNIEGKARLVEIPSLDLYAQRYPFLSLRNVRDRIDLREWLAYHTGKFGEIESFGWRLEKYLQAHGGKYDLIHDNQTIASAFTRIAEKFPVICSAHHPFRRDVEQALAAAPNWWKRMGIKRWYSFVPQTEQVMRSLDCLTTPSQAARRDIIDSLGVAAGKISVIPPGTDERVFTADPSASIDTNMILTTSSSDHAMKGQRYLLTAFAQLAEEFAELKLHVTGPVRRNSQLVKLARKLGVSDKVVYCGLLSEQELAAKYRRAAVTVVPSLYEGFGLPVIEAMACGSPVVTTTASSLPEAAGDAGLLVEPADADGLAAAITRVITDAPLASQLRREGIDHVRRNFTWPVAAQRYIELYEQQRARFCRP